MLQHSRKCEKSAIDDIECFFHIYVCYTDYVQLLEGIGQHEYIGDLGLSTPCWDIHQNLFTCLHSFVCLIGQQAHAWRRMLRLHGETLGVLSRYAHKPSVSQSRRIWSAVYVGSLSSRCGAPSVLLQLQVFGKQTPASVFVFDVLTAFDVLILTFPNSLLGANHWESKKR